MENRQKAAVLSIGAVLLFFLLRKPAQADSGFAPTELRVSPTYPVVGQFCAISIPLENITEETIDYSLTMYLNGVDLSTSLRSLDPGASREPAWDVTEMITQAGNYKAEAKLKNLNTGVEVNYSMNFEVFTEYPY